MNISRSPKSTTLTVIIGCSLYPCVSVSPSQEERTTGTMENAPKSFLFKWICLVQRVDWGDGGRCYENVTFISYASGSMRDLWL